VKCCHWSCCIRINGLSFSLDRIRAFSNSVKRDRCVEKKEKYSLCNIDLWIIYKWPRLYKSKTRGLVRLISCRVWVDTIKWFPENSWILCKFASWLFFCTNHREQIL
jgi:hypothetical protein